MHNRLVGGDRGSVALSSVGSAGFCAGAPSQDTDWGGGGWRNHSWGRPVHQVVLHLHFKTRLITVQGSILTTVVDSTLKFC